MTQLRLVRNFLAPSNYFSLLLSLLCLSVIGPLLNASLIGRIFESAFVLLLVVSISRSVTQNQLEWWLVLLGGMSAWLLINLGNLFPVAPYNTAVFQVFSLIACMSFLVSGFLVIARDVFSGEVTANRICGALCLYLLLGAIFALIFAAIDVVDPNAFRVDEPFQPYFGVGSGMHYKERFSLLLYYSFVTLSTVGFGDISPISRFARNFTWLEAVSGQLYLSVMVARLVGLHLVNVSSKNENGPVVALQGHENEPVIHNKIDT
ncbi:MAG: potassium channel family protein [Candidatus Obscuribacterales bacterium]|nr:potassium channel family protein [Candidatus Obscuribacterales bacterium]